jgi:hypothetical protein
MFSKKDLGWFLAAGLLLTTGFILIATDRAENGFGVPTLWIAPPLLITGFLLVIPGILGWFNLINFISITKFKNERWKHLTGIFVFVITLTTYINTLEPTASLWDCSEFIASAYKLQIPHTPGNPLLLVIGRLFSMLSFGDITQVAWSVNFMSAVFAAATVWLGFYIILYFAKKIFDGDQYALLLACACGSLCLAFSDTFWFSATEAETYAASCFFMVLIIFLILKGCSFQKPMRERVLVLILYLSGLAFCIHPMCLLALPVLPVVWYLNHKNISVKNITVALFIGIAIILFINRFIAVGVFEAAFYFDLLLVNSFHLPFYSGAALLLILIAAFFWYIIGKSGQYRSHVIATLFLLIGFTPYLLLFLRSGYNPPIDESNPENLPLIKAYMNREGYPTRPLLYGPYFDGLITEVEMDAKVYTAKKTGYEFKGTIPAYKYEPSRQTFLPRIYSNDPAHIEAYRKWTGLSENEKPKFTDNVAFLLRYQLGHMYFRYLMFNFAGRESDVQNSDWLKPWEKLNPPEDPYGSKSRNQYWMIPFFLGILGMFYQYKKDKRGFIALTTFFAMTGFLLAIYLNSTPVEPRERDYIYVGSFLAFSFWSGLGILGFLSIVSNSKGKILLFLFFGCVPIWMFYQNYDDHNRSGRTFQIDNARNVLSSCAPKAILFTGGDNDTFPMWYLQEVEGFRTDVRVVVLSYLNTDWYISQLRKTYYDSQAFKFSLDQKDYRQYGPNDVLYVQDQIKNGIDVNKYFGLLKAGHPALSLRSDDGDPYSILPSRKLIVPVKSNPYTNANFFADSNESSHKINFYVTGNYLQKNALAILDLMISNSDRPMYFNFSSMGQTGMRIEPYLVQEGQVFRLNSLTGSKRRIDTELAFSNLMKKGQYENLLNKNIFFNFEDYDARIINPLRQSFNDLAIALIEEDQHDRAGLVLDRALKYLYTKPFKPSLATVQASSILIRLGKKNDAEAMAIDMFEYFYHEETVNQSEFNKQLLEYSADILNSLGRPKYLQSLQNRSDTQ